MNHQQAVLVSRLSQRGLSAHEQLGQRESTDRQGREFNIGFFECSTNRIGRRLRDTGEQYVLLRRTDSSWQRDVIESQLFERCCRTGRSLKGDEEWQFIIGGVG